jgi:hypothetical protein
MLVPLLVLVGVLVLVLPEVSLLLRFQILRLANNSA